MNKKNFFWKLFSFKNYTILSCSLISYQAKLFFNFFIESIPHCCVYRSLFSNLNHGIVMKYKNRTNINNIIMFLWLRSFLNNYVCWICWLHVRDIKTFLSWFLLLVTEILPFKVNSSWNPSLYHPSPPLTHVWSA